MHGFSISVDSHGGCRVVLERPRFGGSSGLESAVCERVIGRGREHRTWTGATADESGSGNQDGAIYPSPSD
ncbi:hypothetical protein [Natronosalvus rutilus]|uniref:Uncharacterized protein n=1 Tax=Natronosalvus rutilus TaxID=2953753 RepID=A0A9E7SVL3_9EURY|nr:hypothetical protein [Natronosalvus rutilus]UTF54610.1 hypothetical protein NGM29_04870 [Natronosalvus rutilus]